MGTRRLLLSGDAQSGTDHVLFSGDMQSGTDVELINWVLVDASLESRAADLTGTAQASGTVEASADLESSAASLNGVAAALIGVEGILISRPSAFDAAARAFVKAAADLEAQPADLDCAVAALVKAAAELQARPADISAIAQTTDAMLAFASLTAAPTVLSGDVKPLIGVRGAGLHMIETVSGDARPGDILLSGDMQSGTDNLLMSGDARRGLLSGRTNAAGHVNAIIKALAALAASDATLESAVLASVLVTAVLKSERCVAIIEVDLDNPHRRIIMPIYY